MRPWRQYLFVFVNESSDLSCTSGVSGLDSNAILSNKIMQLPAVPFHLPFHILMNCEPSTPGPKLLSDRCLSGNTAVWWLQLTFHDCDG